MGGALGPAGVGGLRRRYCLIINYLALEEWGVGAYTNSSNGGPYVLTLEKLRRLVSYDPDTGMFRRNIDGNTYRIGDVAGYINKFGYRCMDVDGRPYRAHRLAWFYMTGVMPSEYVDHINGQKADNRFCNLRLATNSQNQANRPAPKNNTSGIKGVRFEPARNKWRAVLWVQGKVIVLGRFDTKDAAAAAYETAARNAFGEYVSGAERQEPPAAPIKIGVGAVEHEAITSERLRSMFSYDPETGRFTRIKARQGQAKLGDIAGSTEWTGYRGIKIQGKRYREHHLAWLYVHGYMPTGEIDHINGKPDDNRIANLRECNSTQNKWNRRVQTRAVTGKKGVGFDDRCVRKYYARIKLGDKYISLGHFLTAEDAAAAYETAARAAFGEFARTQE
jgi:HNH endonuclease/AP2 domain